MNESKIDGATMAAYWTFHSGAGAGVCEQLNFRDRIHVAETCKGVRHGDGGLETAELPTTSPVVTALRELAFPDGVGIPSTRPVCFSESWAAYLARCARQRRCREAPPIAGYDHTTPCFLWMRQAVCWRAARAPQGQGDEAVKYPRPTPVAPMAGIRCVALRPELATASPSGGMAGSTRGAATVAGNWSWRHRQQAFAGAGAGT
jgi:hypothetical protein